MSQAGRTSSLQVRVPVEPADVAAGVRNAGPAFRQPAIDVRAGRGLFRRRGVDNARRWSFTTNALLAADGFVWGLGGMWFTQGPMVEAAVVAASLCCIACVATFGLQVSFKATSSYVIPMMVFTAIGMLGRGAELKGVTQINVLDTLGLISASFGNWQGVPGGEHVELTDRASDGGKGRHLSLQFHGPRLVGCNAVGWTDHVGVMRGLVEGEVTLTADWKQRLLDDPTKLMDAYLACAQAQGEPAFVKA